MGKRNKKFKKVEKKQEEGPKFVIYSRKDGKPVYPGRQKGLSKERAQLLSDSLVEPSEIREVVV